MTPLEARAALEPPNLVVDARVAAAVTGTSTDVWYERPPIEPLRIGRSKRWRVSELRAWIGLDS